MPSTKKRFTRASITPNFWLTSRDFQILELVYKHRFLSSDHLAGKLIFKKNDRGQSKQYFPGLIELETAKKQIHPHTGQAILRRLHLLFHGGFLDRPKKQLRFDKNHPMIYGLGNKGFELMQDHFDLVDLNVDWTMKNREVKNIFLEHTLMIRGSGSEAVTSGKVSYKIIKQEHVSRFPSIVHQG